MSVLRRLCAALEVELIVTARWRGADGVRLLDAAHATIVNAVVAELRGAGWTVLVEYTFSEWGERGSVDVVAWNPTFAALLIVEVKSVLVDSQDLLAGLDRKCRLVPGIVARERGWHASSVSRLVVLADTTGNRSSVARLRSTLDAALPARTREVRRWLRAPTGPLSGIWFLLSSRAATGTSQSLGARRVRRAGTADRRAASSANDHANRRRPASTRPTPRVDAR